MINSGNARLSHRIIFTSGLLQDPDPLDTVHGYAQANSSIYMNIYIYIYIERLNIEPLSQDPMRRALYIGPPHVEFLYKGSLYIVAYIGAYI